MERLNFRAVTAQEVDVRIQSINYFSVTLLLYKDARVDQNILDETVGELNWQKAYSRDNQNCTVSIWDAEKKRWISKEDTGTESYTEKEKGLASDSFKRACFCWGIGRELYTTPLVRIPTGYIETTIDKSSGKDVYKTYDTFYVDSMNVVTDDNGCKRITNLVIGVEHKGVREVIWKWNEGDLKGRAIVPSYSKEKIANQVYGNKQGGNGNQTQNRNAPNGNGNFNNNGNYNRNNQNGGYNNNGNYNNNQQNRPQQNYQNNNQNNNGGNNTSNAWNNAWQHRND